MPELRSNFGLRRPVIHHREKQGAEKEINNKYISQCLDATSALLGQQNRTAAPEEVIVIS